MTVTFYGVKVEYAFGADPEGDQDQWIWFDASADLNRNDGVDITFGDADESGGVNPASCRLVMQNDLGHYTPDRALSPHYPDVVVGTPVRITVDGDVRFVGQVGSWEVVWPWGDLSHEPNHGGLSRVNVSAAGIFRRLGQGQEPFRSALYRAISTTGTLGSTNLTDPVAYWPLEDESDATQGANAVIDGAPMRPTGEVDWASTDVVPGSAPLPDVLSSGGFLRGQVPGVTGDWTVGLIIAYEATNLWPGVSVLVTGTPYAEIRLVFSDVIEVFGVDSEGATTPLATLVQNLSDGVPRWLEISAVHDGADVDIIVSVGHNQLGLTPLTNASARATGVTLRTRSSGVSATLGHVAAWTTGQTLRGLVEPAIDGYKDETARDRLVRVHGEQGVDFELLGDETVVSDDFDRVESGTWGTAPTGQEWTTTAVVGTVDFDVDGDVATATRTSGTGAAVGTVASDDENVEISASVTRDANTLVVGVIRWVDDQNFVTWAINNQATDNIQVTAAVGGVTVGDVTTTRLGGFTPGTTYHLRAQAQGPSLRLRVWSDAEDEPVGWAVILTEPEAVNLIGTTGVLTTGSTGATATVREFTLTAIVDTQRMGPQERGTFTEIIESCADVDQGILYEQRTRFGTGYRPVADLYNQDPVWTLDASTDDRVADIVNPFPPTLDDLSLRNDVTATRASGSSGGSSARVVDAASVARHGRYDTDVEVNVASDLQLPDQAAWRLHLGTWPGMRYPDVAPALNERSALLPDWRPLRLGDRVDIINLPPQHPVNAVRLVLRGYTENVQFDDLDVRMNATPYGPYVVGIYADDPVTGAPVSGSGVPPDSPQRYDTAGSQSAATFQAGTDTQLRVATTVGQLWTINPVDLPLDVTCFGVRLRVTDIDLPSPMLRSTSGTASGTTGAFTVDTPAGVQAGDLLLLWHATDLATFTQLGTPTGGGTWQLLTQADAGDGTIRVWWRTAGSSEPAGYGLTQPANNDGVAIVAAVEHGRPVRAPTRAIVVDPASSANVDTPSTNVHEFEYGSLELRVACAGTGGAPFTFTPPGGFTDQEEHDSGGFVAAALATRDTGEGSTGVHTFGTSAAVLDKRGVTINVVGTQLMTVEQQPVNGIIKAIPIGSALSLWTPARYAL